MEGSVKRKVETICMTVLGLAVAGLMVFPIIWLGFSSFKPSTELFAYPLHLFPQAPSGESYVSVVADGFFTYVKNSLFLAVVGTLITVVISAMCGYALAIYRKEIPYVNKVFAVFLLGTLIPGEILTIAQFTVVSEMGLYNSIWGCILPVVTTTTGIFMYSMVFPIIWLGFSSFKPSTELFAYPLHLFPQAPSGESYVSVVADGFFTYVKNSLFLAVVGTLITVVISAMCGYALAIYRKEIPYVNKVFAVFLLGTLIPGEILTIAQFTVVSEMGLYNSIWGCILPVVTTTTGIFMYRQHYMSIPLELAESARLDGASEFRIFRSIMLPLGSSVTITLTIFSFMWRWNDYILPLMVLSDQENFTIQIAIKSYIGTMGVDWNSILAASILSILPIIVIFIILQRYITGGLAASGVKG